MSMMSSTMPAGYWELDLPTGTLTLSAEQDGDWPQPGFSVGLKKEERARHPAAASLQGPISRRHCRHILLKHGSGSPGTPKQ
jgi:hypothetical protein